MTSSGLPTLNARTTCVLYPQQVSTILCHRAREGKEQFLVKWKDGSSLHSPSDTVCSWHGLADLVRCLPLVQAYVEQRERIQIGKDRTTFATTSSNKRKRNSPELTLPSSRDETGLLTPGASSRLSTPSVASVYSSEIIDGPDAYNAVLERKEGRFVVKQNAKVKPAIINASKLPTTEMLDEAANCPLEQAQQAVRQGFLQKIRQVPYLYFQNSIDDSTPPLGFTFVRDYVFGKGCYRADIETYEGCQEPCRPNMGQFIGCEYTTKCSCLEYAAVDEEALRKKDPQLHDEYIAAREDGDMFDTLGLPKRFPYHKQRSHDAPQTLQAFYRESRHPIYECNVNCNCGDVCKSRLVQHGRQVPLTIFKTHSRGWGVYCNEDLVQGEFIDTYLGEVITNEEADRREEGASKDKASYMYSLDKFVNDMPDLTKDTCYVVDGQYCGGATRFINHSCEPNCRQYTVSYNRHDPRVYDLAFFAYENIPAGTELTFDYLDKDEEEEDDAVRRRDEAARDPNNVDKVRCYCGARKCRGYLWV